MVARRARVRVAAWVAVERRHCTSARCGHCSTCASDQMLRRIIPTAERTVTRGGNKTIDKGGAIRERRSLGKVFLDSCIAGRCGHVFDLLVRRS
jgi:hypothetical protein